MSRRPVNPYERGTGGAHKAPQSDPDEPYSGSFWGDLLPALAVPLHPVRGIMVFAAGFLIWFSGNLPIIGLFVSGAVSILFLVIWVQSAAQGRQDIFPPMTDFEVGTMVMLAIRALIGCIPVYLPVYFLADMGQPWLVVAWLGVSLPAMLITLSMTEGLVDAANPLYWLRLLTVEPVAFLSVAVLFTVLSVLSKQAVAWIAPHLPIALKGIVGSVVLVFPLVSGAHVLGIYVHSYQDDLME